MILAEFFICKSGKEYTSQYSCKIIFSLTFVKYMYVTQIGIVLCFPIIHKAYQVYFTGCRCVHAVTGNTYHIARRGNNNIILYSNQFENGLFALTCW